MAAQRFPNDTLDCIELLFAKEILLNFPEYATFWESLVGVDFGPGNRHLRARQWSFPPHVAAQEAKRLSTERERITMVSYGTFCNLAGAHFQLSQARAALSESDVSWRYFRFWEAFDVFYQHLGNARNGANAVWKWTKKLTGTRDGTLLDFLAKQGYSHVAGRWRKFDSDAQTIRNNVVHFARGAHVPMSGSFYFVTPVRPNATWSELLARKGPLQEVTRKMDADLAELESILGETFGTVRGFLTSYLARKGITT